MKLMILVIISLIFLCRFALEVGKRDFCHRSRRSLSRQLWIPLQHPVTRFDHHQVQLLVNVKCFHSKCERGFFEFSPIFESLFHSGPFLIRRGTLPLDWLSHSSSMELKQRSVMKIHPGYQHHKMVLLLAPENGSPISTAKLCIQSHLQILSI